MPTLKQRKAFLEVGVNGGNISKAMLAAGYGKSVSGRTDKLTRTKGWKELMDEFLPDELLAKKHRELLEATQKKIIGRKIVIEPDNTNQNKALDTAYKLKGRYSGEDMKPLSTSNTLIQIVINPPNGKARNKPDRKTIRSVESVAESKD